jgi:hypothetical protein
MFYVTATIPIDPEPHMEQLAGHDNFERSWFLQIDASEVDSYGVLTQASQIEISASSRASDSASRPNLKLPAKGCEPQVQGRHRKTSQIFVNIR